MREVIIAKEDELRAVRATEPTKLIIKAFWLSSRAVGYISFLGSELDKKKMKFEIEVHDDRVMPILELTGVTELWKTIFIN